MENLDFLRKDIIDTFSYVLDSESISIEQTVNGRKVIKYGMSLPKVYVANIYKVWDVEQKVNRKIFMVGIGSATKFEGNSCSDEVLYERAMTSLMINPKIVINFDIDADVTFNTFVNIIKMYEGTRKNNQMALTDIEINILDKINNSEYHDKYPYDWMYFDIYNKLKNGSTD